MPLLSCLLAGETVIASGKPYLSTARWILMPLIFLPPSKPRPKQVGAERQERLSMMTALGTGLSPQACRQAWIKWLSRRRHSPSRGQRACTACRTGELANGAPLHAAERHAPDRQDRLAQRRSGQRRLQPGAGPPGAIRRHGRQFHQHRVDKGLDVTESIPRGRRRLGGSEGGAHRRLIRWLLRWPQTEPIALPSVSPHSPQSSILVSTGWHAPSANRFLLEAGPRGAGRPLRADRRQCPSHQDRAGAQDRREGRRVARRPGAPRLDQTELRATAANP